MAIALGFVAPIGRIAGAAGIVVIIASRPKAAGPVRELRDVLEQLSIKGTGAGVEKSG